MTTPLERSPHTIIPVGSAWKLLHEEQPNSEKETYAGFLNRSGELVFWYGLWDEDDWFVLDSLDNGDNAFGYMSFPVDLPVDIYWCFASSFPNEEAAKKSFQDFLSQPCDRP